MPQADEIELPAHMQGGFALLAEALNRFPIPEAMLGGGTVLAALWDHRDSTDLDFALPRSVAESLPVGTPAKFAGSTERELGAKIRRVGEKLDEDAWLVAGDLPDGTPFSLHCLSFEEHSAGAPIRPTGTPSQSLNDIMRGKVAGRAVIAHLLTGTSHDTPPIRDVYDFAICAHLEPDALLRVLDCMSDEFRVMAAKAYLDAPADLYKRDRKPIINPRFEIPMHGLPQTVGQAILEMNLPTIPDAHRIECDDSLNRGSGS